MTEGQIIIDGDFKTGMGNCEFHCSPSCHPAQIGPEWLYGCTHKAWPQNRAGDFVPIVICNGETAKCQLPKRRVMIYRRGLTLRLRNAEEKAAKWKKLIEEVDQLSPQVKK